MIIDAHFHLGYTNSFYMYDTSLKNCLETIDSLGISHCINAHLLGLTCDEANAGLEEDIQAYEQSNGRIFSYFVFHPSDYRKSIRTMEEYHYPDIFKAIKIHPSFDRIYADSRVYRHVWEYAKKTGLPIMSHSWGKSAYNPVQKYSFPSLFESFIQQYPEVTFILGHAGGRYDGILVCVELCKKYPNVHVDTSGDVYYNGLIEYLVGEIGSRKILFGSDALWIDPRTQLGMILGADISNEAMHNILYGNAKRIFSI